MKRLIHAAILLGMLLPFSLLSQNIVQAEYYWDNDPGVGLGIGLTVPFPYSATADFNESVSTSTLTAGLHTLYVRVKSSGNDWSLVEGAQVYVSQPEPQSTLVGAEYFWDTDPGEGQGVSLTLPAPFTDQADITESISTSGLLPGLHYLYIRERDNNNVWGIPEGRMVYVAQPGNTAVIHAAEYFLDSDPGEGNGTALPVPAPYSDLLVEDFSVSTTGLSSGIHTVYFRCQDNSGRWGIPEGTSFAVLQSDAVNNISAAEYFIDNDPGEGNGTSLSVPVPNTDLIVEGFSIPTGGLSQGLHTVYFRSRDSNGLWGFPAGVVFSVQRTDVYSVPTATEYFWDTDPGVGNGIAITGGVTSGDSLVMNASISTNALDPGMHYLYVRSRDSIGNWGLPASRQVQVVLPDFSIRANTTNVCPGDSLQYHVVTNSTNPGLTFDWYYEPTHILQLVQSGTGTTLKRPVCDGFISCIMHVPASSATTNPAVVASDFIGSFPYTHLNATPGPGDVNITYPTVELTANQWPYCPNDSLIIRCNHSCSNLSATYRWSINLIPIGTTDSVLRLPPHYLSGFSPRIDVSVTYTSACGQHYTAAAYLNVLVSDHPLVAVVNVGNSSGLGCLPDGDSTLNFSAIVTGQGSNYSFEWKVDNTIVQTGPSAQFTAIGLSGGELISCTLSGTSTCTNGPFTAQSQYEAAVVCPPQVSIYAPPDVDFGSSVLYTAIATNAGSSPTYDWIELLPGGLTTLLQSGSINTISLTACERTIYCIVTAGSDSRSAGNTAYSNTLESQYENSAGVVNASIVIHMPAISTQGISSACPNSWVQITGIVNTVAPIPYGNVFWIWYQNGGIVQWTSGGAQDILSVYVGTLSTTVYVQAYIVDECGQMIMVETDKVISSDAIQELHLTADQDLSLCPQGFIGFNAALSISSSDAVYTWTYNSQVVQTGYSSTFNISGLSPGDTIAVSVSGTTDCTGASFTVADYIYNSCPPIAYVYLHFYVQGYYQGNGIMKPVLANSATGYTNPYICDSVDVELHQQGPLSNTVISFSTIFNIYGFCRLEVPRAYASETLYVVLKPRNSLETWSAVAVPILQGWYDFNYPTAAYGNNLCNLGDGNYALWSGDISNGSQQNVKDGFINEDDYAKMETLSGDFRFGYLRADITGDGVVESSDYSLLENNLLLNLQVLHP